MDTATWHRLKALFHEAVALERPARSSFLDAHCSRDARLRAELEALLRAHDDTDGSDDSRGAALDDSGSADAAGAVLRATTPLAAASGSVCGPYVLVRRLGEGGFGVVYLAEQECPVRRKVALKIIKLGMDTRQVIARFEAERQALALMDHPHIARVLDGGATESGRPYFVMELVQGVPVVEYCDTHGLDICERLELFALICQAVQHAHQKGIIHRDLKPSNILVGTVDGRPQPKVIDFGIAKALRERLTDKTLLTDAHQMIGTPQYMSPEQVDNSVDIDTRSDVYSLGVLLYELLAGRTPFDLQRLRSAAEIQQVIREVEPPRPSARVSMLRTTGGSPTPGPKTSGPVAAEMSAVAVGGIQDVARQRRTDAVTLVRQLRGELDWIVMKALEKDRAQRYDSASALADDVVRFLRDEAVSAGPPSHTYRFRKLLKRHRAAFAATAAVTISLLLALVGTLAGLVQVNAARSSERDQRRKAEASEQAARSEAQRANEMAGFLKQTLLSIDPAVAQGRDTTVLRDVLAETSRRLNTELTGEPQVRAELALLVGQVYNLIGQPASAVTALRGCLATLDRDYGDAPNSLRVKALLQLTEALQVTGDLDSAWRAVDQARALGASVSPLEALQTHRLASELKRRQGQFQEAEREAQEALQMAATLDPPAPSAVVQCQVMLALAKSDLLEHDQAEQLLQAALAQQKAHLGDEHLQVAFTLEYLGIEQYELGRLDEAAATQQRVLDLERRLLGDDHPRTANAKASLGLTRLAQGDYQPARGLLEEAVAATRKTYGDTNLALANHLATLGNVRNAIGDLEGAGGAHEEAAAILERMLPLDHPMRVLAEERLAYTLAQLKRNEEAYAAAHRALQGAAGDNPGLSADEVIAVRETVAGIAGDWGEEEASRGNFEHALTLVREARARYEDAVRRRAAIQPADDWQVVDACAQIGTNLMVEADILQRAQRDTSSALALLARAEPLCLDAATRFTRDDDNLPAASRGFLVKRAVERMTALYRTWEDADPNAGKSAVLADWEKKLQDVRARYTAAPTSQAVGAEAPLTAEPLGSAQPGAQ